MENRNKTKSKISLTFSQKARLLFHRRFPHGFCSFPRHLPRSRSHPRRSDGGSERVRPSDDPATSLLALLRRHRWRSKVLRNVAAHSPRAAGDPDDRRPHDAMARTGASPPTDRGRGHRRLLHRQNRFKRGHQCARPADASHRRQRDHPRSHPSRNLPDRRELQPDGHATAKLPGNGRRAAHVPHVRPDGARRIHHVPQQDGTAPRRQLISTRRHHARIAPRLPSLIHDRTTEVGRCHVLIRCAYGKNNSHPRIRSGA